MFERLLHLSIHSKQSYFLFGPRGVGKTSWLKTHFPNALLFDLLHHDTYINLLGNPSRLEHLIPTDYVGWVIIDEIQKAPELLDEVHRLIESRKLRFILTGSSARKLKQQGVNLLGGRALVKHLYPLTAMELQDDFSLTRSLLYGHLPLSIQSDNPKAFLASYISTYLKEEVMQEGLTRHIALFTRFLEVASFSEGEMLNYSQIAQEIATTRYSVETFFQILEDLLIAVRISPFTKRAKRDIVKSVKFYYFDVGVYRTLRPKGPIDLPEEIDGAALETLFFQEARAINDYFELEYTFYFWRTKTKLEVDFILYGEKGLLAFEIKRKSSLKTEDYKGLRAFLSDYPTTKAYLLYGGTESFTFHDIHVMPFDAGIRSLGKLLGIP